MKAISKTGFSIDIDQDVIDDWETLEVMAKADAGSMQALIESMKRILGNDGYDQLKEHVRSMSKNGKVSTKKMQKEFTDLMTSIMPKN